MKVADLFPPGTDLCKIPAGVPPDGQAPNLVDPPSLKALTIAVCVPLTAWATVFTVGRLYANKRQLKPGDVLVFMALLLDIAHAVILSIFSSSFRHKWDMPLCALIGTFSQFTLSWTILNSLGLMFAKTATLLLFNQLFTVSTRMRWAIRAGHVANVVTYTTSIAVCVYSSAPHIGQSWDDLTVVAFKDANIFIIYWGIANGAMGLLLDIYIFILPLPVVLRLKLSARRRVQIVAIFLTAVLGVVSSILSLVYRVRALTEEDKLWEAGAIMNCNLVEMNVATIIASAPGFAKFMRRHVLDSKPVQSLRSMLGRSGAGRLSASSCAEKQSPNQPRTGRDDGAQGDGPRSRFRKLSDTWFLKTQSPLTERESSLSTADHDADGIRLIETSAGDRSLKAASSPV